MKFKGCLILSALVVPTFSGLISGHARGIADKDVPGVYSLPQSSELHGNILLSPDNIYLFATFGTVQFGTWGIYKQNIILEPANLFEDLYYISMVRNHEREDIYIQFDGFAQMTSLYSFDNDDFAAPMHPVFNPWPNCTADPNFITFEKGEHKSLKLAETRWYEPWEGVLVYNFLLPSDGYNEFTVFALGEEAKPKDPLIFTLHGDRLTAKNQVYAKNTNIRHWIRKSWKWLKGLPNSWPKVMQPQYCVPYSVLKIWNLPGINRKRSGI